MCLCELFRFRRSGHGALWTRNIQSIQARRISSSLLNTIILTVNILGRIFASKNTVFARRLHLLAYGVACNMKTWYDHNTTITQ